MTEYLPHPLALQYPRMTSEELSHLAEDMRTNGFDPAFPIYLYQGMILDGVCRFEAAKAAGVEASFQEFTGNDTDATLFVATANENRRHLTPKWLSERRAERIKRVAQARKEGKSTRKIAQEQGVSQPQVRRDIAEAQKDENPPKPSGETGGVSPNILCERCAQVGYQEGCTACAYLAERKNTTTEKKPVVDDNGTVVPIRLIPVFESVPLFHKAIKTLNACAKAFKAMEACAAKEGKPIDAARPFERFYGPFKNARWRAMNLRPAIVCPKCEGDGCEECRDKGWLTVEEEQARPIGE